MRVHLKSVMTRCSPLHLSHAILTKFISTHSPPSSIQPHPLQAQFPLIPHNLPKHRSVNLYHSQRISIRPNTIVRTILYYTTRYLITNPPAMYTQARILVRSPHRPPCMHTPDIPLDVVSHLWYSTVPDTDTSCANPHQHLHCQKVITQLHSYNNPYMLAPHI